MKKLKAISPYYLLLVFPLLQATKALVGPDCADIGWRRFKPVHDAETGLYL